MIAFTRAVPSSIVRCELTHVGREAIDVELARAQHEQYENALRSAGVDVRRLPPRDDCPDSVFVEDTAVVFGEVAIMTRPGAPSRCAEVESVREALEAHRTLASVAAPATVDGGDVLVLDREVLVGLTPRTTISGMQQLRALLAPFGYEVRGIPIRGCLHLKSAVTRAGPKTLVLNPSWVDPGLMPGWDVVPVDQREPFAGNVLWLGATTIVSDAFERTNAALSRATDSTLVPVPASELAKAEGGVTCCSLILSVER
jgi:dimethylargininase